MLKSAAYVFVLTVATSFVVYTAVSIPHLFSEGQTDDLSSDLSRSWSAAMSQIKVLTYKQVVSAQNVASDPGLVTIFAESLPDTDDEEGTEKTISASKVETFAAEKARREKKDLVTILDANGKVLASSHEEGPEPGQDLSGLPSVKDAMQGVARDWVWTSKADVILTAAYPIIVQHDGKAKVMGVALVGERMDSSMASDLASLIEPVRSNNSYTDMAFILRGRKLGSSVKDAEIQSVINMTLSNTLQSFAPEDFMKNLKFSYTSDDQIAYVAGKIQEDQELGLVMIMGRKKLKTNIHQLAAGAFALDLPAGQGPPILIIILFAIVAFLIFILLVNSELNAPGRKMVAELSRIENHIEEGELSAQKYKGIYFKTSKNINTILIGLRKRLERERSIAQEKLVSSDVIEAIEDVTRTSSSSIDVPKAPVGLPSITESASELPTRNPTGGFARMPTGQFALIEKAAKKRVELDDNTPPPSPFLTHQNLSDQKESPPALEKHEENPSAASISEAAEAMSDKLSAQIEVAKEPVDKPDDDATIDIGPKQLKNLMTKTGSFNIDMSQSSSDILSASTPPKSLKIEEKVTAVDSLGVMQHLAQNTLEEEKDLITGSAIAASADSQDNVSTAEVPRDDENFQAALEASAAKSRGPFTAENSQVRPFPGEAAIRTGPNPFLHQTPTTPGVAPPQKDTIDPDQEYFKRLFNQFVETKKTCDEPIKGLTLEKFVKRLQRNKAQLMERYKCRSVRFQVYVKNGKSALKATPIK
jgi:hypothetical protein